MAKKYYVFNENDITKHIDYDTRKNIMKKYGLIGKTNNQINRILILGYPHNGYIFVEDDVKQKDVSNRNKRKDVMFYEAKSGRRYFVNKKGEFYYIYKTGKKHSLRIYEEIDKDGYKRLRIFVQGRFLSPSLVMAENYLYGFDKSKHKVMYKDNNIKNLNYKNLYYVDNNYYYKNYRKIDKNAKSIGLFENGELIKTFDTINDCSKALFMDRSTVSRIAHGMVKNKAFDLRFI